MLKRVVVFVESIALAIRKKVFFDCLHWCVVVLYRSSNFYSVFFTRLYPNILRISMFTGAQIDTVG